jgi:hypothetical protein
MAGTGAGETAMAVLTVDLQEGFRDDHVVVRVDGREVYAKRGVSTNWSIGRADGVEVDVPAGTVAVVVEVPSRGLSDRLDVDVPDRRYLGVSVGNGRLRFDVAEQPFTYF